MYRLQMALVAASLLVPGLAPAAPIPAPATADPGQELAARTLPSVVTIRMFDQQANETGLGSGFWIGGGEIATNAHVVAGGAWAEIHSVDGTMLGTAPYAVLLDPENDLAVLAVPGGRPFGLALAEGDARVGQSVWAFGAPLGLEGTVSSGIISATRDGEQRHLLQMTAPISVGSSGGPVVDTQGLVVGVSVGMMAEGQNLNFAVPASVLAALLRQERGRVVFPDEAMIGGSGRRGEDASGEPDAEQVLGFLTGLAAADSLPYYGSYNGRLDAGDVDFEGPTDFYRFIGSEGQHLDIAVRSRDFDALVEVMATHRMLLDDDFWSASDDDGGGGTDAAVSVTLPSSGAYHVAVRAIGVGRGAYTLTIQEHQDSPAPDSRWLRVGGDDEMEAFIDRLTIARAGSQVTAWVRMAYHEPTADSDGIQYDTATGQWTFDCSLRRFKLKGMQRALRGDSVDVEEIPEYLQKWQGIAPETWAERILEEACRH